MPDFPQDVFAGATEVEGGRATLRADFRTLTLELDT